VLQSPDVQSDRTTELVFDISISFIINDGFGAFHGSFRLVAEQKESFPYKSTASQT
jgi:hypothetical protein